MGIRTFYMVGEEEASINYTISEIYCMEKSYVR